MIIYVTEPKEIEPEALELLRMGGHTVVTTPEEAAKAQHVEALFIRTYTTVDATLLEQFPSVRFVLRAGVGLDNVDMALCKSRGIEVINSPGANAHAVAEYTVASVLYLLRFIDEQRNSLRSGGWRLPSHIGSELRGKTVGLLGCGNVGRLIAHKLSTWELNECLGYDPYLSQEQLAAVGIRKVEKDELLKRSDIVSLHLPLTPETAHTINAEAFQCMKPSALFINAARGGVVDEAALLEALAQKRIAGAALDVFEHEPQVGDELKRCERVILTPHIAGYTHEANREVSLSPVREFLKRTGV